MPTSYYKIGFKKGCCLILVIVVTRTEFGVIVFFMTICRKLSLVCFGLLCGTLAAQTPQLPTSKPPLSQSMDVKFGDLTFKVPATYLLVSEPGSILGAQYFAKLQGQTNPDMYFAQYIFGGSLEEAANTFFDANFASRFTLLDSSVISGSPRKIMMSMRGKETLYDVYIMDVSHRGGYLVAIVPLPKAVELVYSESAKTILSTGSY